MPLIASKPHLLPDNARPVQVVMMPARGDEADSHILAIMHNVTTIHEIKTEIGYSRAWIRLALEQKVIINTCTFISHLGTPNLMYQRVH